MDSKAIGFLAVALLFLAAPIYVWYGRVAEFLFKPETAAMQNTFAIFQLIGMLAFTLAFFQIVVGSFRKRFFNKHFLPHQVLNFHMKLGMVTLVAVLLHPFTLLFFSYQLNNAFDVAGVFVPKTLEGFEMFSQKGEYGTFIVSLGPIALYTLLVGVFAMILERRLGHQKAEKIHRLNYLAFFLLFFHSFFAGTDLKHPLLQTLWVFYALVAVAGLLNRIHEIRPSISVGGKRIYVGSRPSKSHV